VSRVVAVALVVVALTAVSVAVVGTVAAAEEANATNNASGSSSSWTATEIRSGGETIAGAAPSQRWLGTDGSVYVDYSNPNPLVGGSGEDWEAGVILEPGSKIQADQLRIHAQRARDAGIDKYRVRLVYANMITRQVTEGNTTRTVTEAANVTTGTQKVEFAGPFSTGTVNLRRSDAPRNVLMILENPETGEEVARWSFRHESVATTQAAGISSMGDLLGWVGVWIVLPLVVLTVAVGYLSRAAIRRAGKGPDMGPVFWTGALGAGTFFGVALAYSLVADWLVALPLAIPVGLALFIGIVYIETTEVGVEEVEFIKPDLSLAKSPSGEDGVDMIKAESTTEKVIRDGPVHRAVVRDGIRPFLSRVFGGAAPLVGSDDLATRIDIYGDDADHDAMVFVHPESGSVLDYEPEGWQLELPSLADREEQKNFAVLAAVALAFTAGVGQVFGFAAGVVAFILVVAGIALRPRSGFARVMLAPAHMRAAFASMMYLGKELDNAETIEAARSKLVELQAQSEKDVEKAITSRDSTLVQEMHNVDADAAVDELSTDKDDDLDKLIEDGQESGVDQEVPADD